MVWNFWISIVFIVLEILFAIHKKKIKNYEQDKATTMEQQNCI